MKYSLTTNTKQFNGVTLYQIKAQKDFGSVKKGELGGWIEKERNLSQDGSCWVCGNAQVCGDALVCGNAQVCGDALVHGDAQVHGNALVCGDALVHGDALVYGNAQVFGDALVYGNAQVCGNARVCGNAQVYGNAQVFGNARLNAKSRFTKGHFIGGDDSGKITKITEQTGSTFWAHQYVLGDFEIIPIEEPKISDATTDAIELLKKNGYKIVKE
jgi:carbonic anhydrase/acetyltransferase-like protein (isoleucine patch superfamily)